MARYRFTKTGYYGDRLYQPGEEISLPDGAAVSAHMVEIRDDTPDARATQANEIVDAVAREMQQNLAEQRVSLAAAAERARLAAAQAREQLAARAKDAAEAILREHQAAADAAANKLDEAETALRSAEARLLDEAKAKALAGVLSVFTDCDASIRALRESHETLVTQCGADMETARSAAEAKAHAAAAAVMGAVPDAPPAASVTVTTAAEVPPPATEQAPAQG